MKSSEASAIRKGDADSCFENRKLILEMVIRAFVQLVSAIHSGSGENGKTKDRIAKSFRILKFNCNL
jgi:hypothetical protein